MATRKNWTDEQVAQDVERLKKSEHVKLCAAEQRLKKQETPTMVSAALDGEAREGAGGGRHHPGEYRAAAGGHSR